MKIFGQLIRTAVNVATLPVAIGMDALTLGGTMNGKDEPYTVKVVKQLKDEAQEDCDNG